MRLNLGVSGSGVSLCDGVYVASNSWGLADLQLASTRATTMGY